MPILPQYGPSLLVECKNALALAEDLVAEWLAKWMFKDVNDGPAKARGIAKRLADHSSFKSHGRPIHREAASEMGLGVDHLESDQALQDLARTIYHACSHVFGATPAVKIVENHLGRAYVKQQMTMPMPQQVEQQKQQPAPAKTP